MATETARKYVSARIRLGAMGSFLNPPGHPEHTSSVETDLERRQGDRGAMSLTAASECDYIDPAVRVEAKRKLDGFQTEKQPLDSAEVQGWIRQVLGYFRGCYRNSTLTGGAEWHAQNLVIDVDRNPIENVDDHVGVHFIRWYYPEFTPTVEHFASARWGAAV